jgi:hypothetical protein
LLVQGIPKQVDAKASGKGGIPLRIAHLQAVRLEPEEVFDASAPDLTSLKEVAAAKDRVLLADLDHALHEGVQFAVLGSQVPIYPTEVIVLAIGVVVTLLRMP